MRVEVADHPTAAVEVDDGREFARVVGGQIAARRNVASRAGNDHLVDLGDGLGLTLRSQGGHRLAGLLRREFVERRRAGPHVEDGLGFWGDGHKWFLSG